MVCAKVILWGIAAAVIVVVYMATRDTARCPQCGEKWATVFERGYRYKFYRCRRCGKAWVVAL
jgi:hydrogenase maturation factor HypF (carbamoyltransferase family)